VHAHSAQSEHTGLRHDEPTERHGKTSRETGLQLHFPNPSAQLKNISVEDVRRVQRTLSGATDLSHHEIIDRHEIISVRLDLIDIEASMQIYERRHCRMSGNVIVTTNNNSLHSLRKIRSVLLRSLWFADVPSTDEGTTPILPNISKDGLDLSIYEAMSRIGGNLGAEGIRSTAEYIHKSGMDPNGEVYQILSSAIPRLRHAQLEQNKQAKAGNDTFTLCLKNWRQLTRPDEELDAT
jgi:hypothetical protein